jgi:hypothetical protein
MKADRPKKRTNAAQKRVLRSEELKDFEKKAGRKAQKNKEPNDRKYDHAVARATRRMKPELLDRLLRDGDED